MAAVRERQDKHVPAATDMHKRMNGVVLAGRDDKLQGKQLLQPCQFCTGVCEEKTQLEGSRHLREDFRTEAEKSPLLAAVTRERLVKTQQAGKA
jgi:hypothetical protein